MAYSKTGSSRMLNGMGGVLLGVSLLWVFRCSLNPFSMERTEFFVILLIVVAGLSLAAGDRRSNRSRAFSSMAVIGWMACLPRIISISMLAYCFDRKTFLLVLPASLAGLIIPLLWRRTGFWRIPFLVVLLCGIVGSIVFWGTAIFGIEGSECRGIEGQAGLRALYHHGACDDLLPESQRAFCRRNISNNFDVILGPAGRKLYVSHAAPRRSIEDRGESLTVTDLRDIKKNRILSLPENRGFGGFMVPDRETGILFHLVYHAPFIQAIDMKSSSDVKDIAFTEPEKPDFQSGVIDEKGNRVIIVTETRPLRLFAIDRESLEAVQVGTLDIPPYNGTYDMVAAPGRRSLFLDCLVGPGFWELDMDTLEVKRTSFVGFFSSGMAVDEGSSRLFVGKPLRSRIDVYDMDRMEKTGELPAGFGVRDLYYDSSRQWIYSTNYFEGTVDVIDADFGERVARRFVGPLVRNLDADVERGLIYCVSACGVFEIRLDELSPPFLPSDRSFP